MKTPVVACVLMAAALVVACGSDETPDSGSQSARTDTTRTSGGDDQTDSISADAKPTGGGFKCDPADARRPDNPRKWVAGSSAPAVPRRSCTLPQEGCVTTAGREDLAAPPAPGIDVVGVTKTAIHVAYDLGSDLSECEPVRLRATVYTTASGLPPTGHDYPVSGRTGTLRVELTKLPVDIDHGPPDILFISSTTEEGLRSEVAGVGLPPADGERRLSRAEVKRIEAHREACRGTIGRRAHCELPGKLHTSGPVTEGTPAELTQSVRKSLGAYGGFTITRLQCRNGTRCDAAFALGHGRRLEMSYRIEALESLPACWALTAFRVVRPVPDLSNFAAPLPNRGCVNQ